jgi:capsular polysaccharide biosynthesis protein
MLVIQVYIIRANEFTTADGAISLLNLEVHKKGKLSSKLLSDLQSGQILVHGYEPTIESPELLEKCSNL